MPPKTARLLYDLCDGKKNSAMARLRSELLLADGVWDFTSALADEVTAEREASDLESLRRIPASTLRKALAVAEDNEERK